MYLFLFYIVILIFVVLSGSAIYIYLDTQNFFEVEQKMYVEMYKDKFGRIHNKERVKIKNYFLKGFFLQIIMIDNEAIKKYYYFRTKKPGKYLKVFSTNKKYV